MIKKFRLLKVLSFLLITLLFTISIGYASIPRLKLNGKSDVMLKLNSNYKDSGISVKNLFGNTKYKVQVKGKVNKDKVGKYKLTYIVKEKFHTYKITRIVEVKDETSPEITLEGGEEVSVCPNMEYTELGYSALDNYDGDITDKVEIISDKDFIKYKVMDSSKNVATKMRKLKYEDITQPSIELKGNTTMSITRYSKYMEPGFTSLDNCDGDITSNVVITGSVNTDINGTYKLTYTATDSSGNSISADRTIKVYTPQNNSSAGGSGIIYLTFDDGPSASVTGKILDILKEEGIKATFFVINHSDSLNYLIKREYDEGHTVGLHSFTHNYGTIYSSADAYFNDLNLISNKVKNIIGQETKIIRFPGGSSNTVSRKYASGIMSYLTSEVANRGYVYFDWNVGSGDSGGANTSGQVYNNVVKGLSKSRANVVLMHDFENNYKTLNALRDIIRYGKNNGYSFDKITTSTFQAKQRVNN